MCGRLPVNKDNLLVAGLVGAAMCSVVWRPLFFAITRLAANVINSSVDRGLQAKVRNYRRPSVARVDIGHDVRTG